MHALRIALILLLCSCSSSNDATTSSSDTQGTPSHCDLTADVGYCVGFDATAPKGSAKANCDGAKSTLGYNGVVSETTACPTTNSVGTCVATISGVKTTYVYYSPKRTAAAAQENCKGLGGAFTP